MYAQEIVWVIIQLNNACIHIRMVHQLAQGIIMLIGYLANVLSYAQMVHIQHYQQNLVNQHVLDHNLLMNLFENV